MNEVHLKRYTFGDYLGLANDRAHSVLAETRKRMDVDEDMPRLIAACGIAEGDVVLDVGAFIGDTALPLLEVGATVVAFEPFLDAYVAMLYNTTGKFVRPTGGRKIKCMNVPVGNGEWVELVHECPGSNFGMRRVVPSKEGAHGAVKTVRLDDLFYMAGDAGGRIKLIKIDCEGSEIPTLEGARKLIARDRPFLYVEHYVEGLKQRGYTEKDLTDCIASLGYVMEMWGEPPRWDWLATPQEKAKT
jgi:FkbM family methyltransferase